MAPPEGPTETTTTGFTKVAAYPDGTTKDFRAPNSVKLTLRAFQLKPFCDVNYNGGDCIEKGVDLIYDPKTDLPSAAVGSWPCLMRESEIGDPEAAGCFNASAADLVPMQDDGITYLNPPTLESSKRGSFPAGTQITFPLGDWDGTWVLKNQADHPDAFAAAENGELTQGYYLCPQVYIENHPEYLPLDVGGCTPALYQDLRPTDNMMDPEEEIGITPAPFLEIPIDTEPGLYYLTVYVDDQIEISELNDVNNTAYFLIEVQPAQIWEIVGPMQPWYEGYPATAGTSIPIKWYYEEDGLKVDSYSDGLEMRVSGPSGYIGVVNDSGSSRLRYVTGDWQFNWDTVGLPVGWYELYIYQPLTGQIDGPFGFDLR
jgi:hypothetical protein